MSNYESTNEYLARVKRAFDRDYDHDLSSELVVRSADARWLNQSALTTPARIGPLLTLPTRTFEISLQEIAAKGATDLQRHAHEAVHYVQEGRGYSEIGDRTNEWREGDFIYTPPWAIHRHYNESDEIARLIIIENSKLLEFFGLHARETFGLVSYADHEKSRQEP